MDIKTLITVHEKLNDYFYEVNSSINPRVHGMEEELKELRKLSKASGISQCINIVDTLITEAKSGGNKNEF